MVDASIATYSHPGVIPLLAVGDTSFGEITDLVALAVFAVLAVIVGLAMLLLSEILGPRRKDSQKESIYECGVPLLDSAREPFTVKFYLVAILFILFDIETVFLLPYALVYRQLGVIGLAEMGAFIFVLAGGLIYLWKRGALEWD